MTKVLAELHHPPMCPSKGWREANAVSVASGGRVMESPQASRVMSSSGWV